MKILVILLVILLAMSPTIEAKEKKGKKNKQKKDVRFYIDGKSFKNVGSYKKFKKELRAKKALEEFDEQKATIIDTDSISDLLDIDTKGLSKQKLTEIIKEMQSRYNAQKKAQTVDKDQPIEEVIEEFIRKQENPSQWSFDPKKVKTIDVSPTKSKKKTIIIKKDKNKK